MATRLFAGFLTAPRRSLILLASCATIGGTGATFTTGCESLPAAAGVIVSACVQVVAELLDMATPNLPSGYEPCGAPIVWTVHNGTIKACLYCSKANPRKVYVQLDCSGKFYPMNLRPIEGKPAPLMEGVDPGEPGLYKVFCDELFIAQARATYDEWRRRVQVSIDSPNLRMLPSPAGYRTLTVLIDGAPVSFDAGFEIEYGTSIELEGEVDDVARYAMNAGVQSIMFEDGGKSYEIHLNREISAMMVFENEQCIDKRLLFAPTP